jgi:hypothetical protein
MGGIGECAVVGMDDDDGFKGAWSGGSCCIPSNTPPLAIMLLTIWLLFTLCRIFTTPRWLKSMAGPL